MDQFDRSTKVVQKIQKHHPNTFFSVWVMFSDFSLGPLSKFYLESKNWGLCKLREYMLKKSRGLLCFLTEKLLPAQDMALLAVSIHLKSLTFINIISIRKDDNSIV